MKSIQKLFLLSVLGLGVYVNQALADEATDNEIHKVVVSHMSSVQGNDAKALANALEKIKADVSEIIKKSLDSDKYSTLQAALSKLDPTAMYAAITQLKIILANVPAHTKDLIMKKYPILQFYM